MYTVPDVSVLPRFSGIRTFMRMSYEPQPTNTDFVILGAPFDTAASYRTGARFGPDAIRQSSAFLRPANSVHKVRPSDHMEGVDGGDIQVIPGNTLATHRNIEAHIKTWAEKKVVPITFGGDHSVTLPELRALSSIHGPLALILFDSHTDTWDEYWGEKYTHGTTFRRALEEGLIDPAKSTMIGMRGTVYSPNDIEEARSFGFKIITAEEVRQLGFNETIEIARERIDDSKAFLSFDIDFLDPVYAPGTGTPEIGGFTSAEALLMLRQLTNIQFVGFDIVEVLPAMDVSEITAMTAATIAFEFLCLLALNKE